MTLREETKDKLQIFWKPYRYLVIDEMSMLSKTFLAKLSHHISIGKMMEDHPPSSHPFGGINVIMSLYFLSNAQCDSTESQIGATIFQEFEMVVLLREQMCMQDPEWLEFLRHLRQGQVKEDDIVMLRSLVLTDPTCIIPDFSCEPWLDVSLVTPRHAVRQLWNKSALKKHAQLTKCAIVQFKAEDTTKGRPLSLIEHYGVASHLSHSRGTDCHQMQQLPSNMELTTGMKVMVTENVETDLDITNGVRATIVGIICHPDELSINHKSAEINLERLLLYILVKMDRTRISKLTGLDSSVIPVEPATRTFRIKMQDGDRKQTMCSVQRHQFPMTAAYAFTDY
ncbi:hypothetical protein F5141DRAFT_1001393 [Pisolithus sp. B1]|nr:hypothetical protein F5141DRAFT_1001393 [Pisolithus sp. B1]